MGIIFNLDAENKKVRFFREFEADGQSNEDEDDDEYTLDEPDDDENNDDQTTEGGEGNNEEAGNNADGDGPTTDEGDDDEYTLGEPEDDTAEGNGKDAGDEGGEGTEGDQPQVDTADDDEYTLDDPDAGEGGDTGGTEGEEGQEGSGGEGDDGTPDMTAAGEGDDDEYSMDGDEGSDDGGGEEGSSDDDTGDDGSAENLDSNLKQVEAELFDALSPEQKQIKIDELKKCFQELYERCDTIIDALNNATAPNDATSKVFEYLNDNLTDLKQYVYDYFAYTFNTKSYLENNAQYQKYIATLNSFNSILEELLKSNNNNDKK